MTTTDPQALALLANLHATRKADEAAAFREALERCAR